MNPHNANNNKVNWNTPLPPCDDILEFTPSPAPYQGHRQQAPGFLDYMPNNQQANQFPSYSNTNQFYPQGNLNPENKGGYQGGYNNRKGGGNGKY